MENLTKVNRSEMKNIMGGVMDKDTTLQHCLDHISFEDTGNETLNNSIKDVLEGMCWDAWRGMIS